VPIGDVTNNDGTSNTLFMAEQLGGKYPQLPRDLSLTWFGSGAWPVVYGMPETDHSNTAAFALSSYHTGVVNFAFCDGSVRALRKGSSTDTGIGSYNYRLRQLAGYKDGRNDDVSSIMP